MKRTLLALALTAVAAPLFAADPNLLVARVNGREITAGDINEVWSQVPEQIQAQYLKAGGKAVFLDNFIAKMLVVDEAVKSGYAAKVGAPAVLEAKDEAALFDRYVRDVIAASVVTEDEMRKVYDAKRSEFAAPEQAHLSTIRVLKKDNPELARETMAKVMVEIFTARTALAQQVAPEELADAMAAKFAEVAARVSDHPSASQGGELGYVTTHSLDPKIAAAARTMKARTVSGILETGDAFQMVLLHEYLPAGMQSFEAVRGAIREYLLAQNAKKVMAAVKKKTDELRSAGKIEVFAKNLQ